MILRNIAAPSVSKLRWGWYNVRAIECGDWLPSLRVARKLAEVLKVDPMDVDEFKAAIEKAAKRSKISMSHDPLPPPTPSKTTAQPQSASHGLELRKRLSAWYGGISIWYGNMSIRWKVAIIALALIAVVLGGLIGSPLLSLSDGLTLLVTVTLVLVTMVYAAAVEIEAKATRRMANEAERQGQEVRRQRMDSLRPLLVPHGHIENLAIGRTKGTDHPTDFLSAYGLEVHNIGAGPAVNIRVRLEARDVEPTAIVLAENETYVRPLCAEHTDQIHGMKAKEMPHSDQHWLVISYQDTFGRHHTTEGRYDWQLNDWVDLTTKCEGD